MKKTILSLVILLNLSVLAQSNDINAGLVAYFPLDNDVNDYSPLHINGTNYNAVPQSDGNHDYYYFNGTNAYIYAGNDDRGIVDSLSVSVWVKTTATDYQWVVGDYNHLDDKGFQVLVNDGHAQLVGRDGSNTFYRLSDNDFINDGEWHHIVALITNDQWKLIVDCEIKGILITNLNNPTYGVNSQPFSISKYPQLQGGTDPIHFAGGIDEIRVYNRQLSLCEICELQHTFDADQDPGAIKQESNRINLDIFKIYPNPTENYFTIDLNKKPTGNVQVEIYNFNGQLVLIKTFSNKSIIIQSNNFISGTYIVKLTINGKSYAKKLIIQ